MLVNTIYVKNKHSFVKLIFCPAPGFDIPLTQSCKTFNLSLVQFRKRLQKQIYANEQMREQIIREGNIVILISLTLFSQE